MRRDAKTLSPFVMLITVLSVGLQDISAGAVSPAISAICQSYPSVSIGMIQMIVTLPTLAICIMAPVYGWLSNRIQPRRLIIYGLLLFCIGGSLPVFLNNLPLIMICRVALGVKKLWHKARLSQPGKSLDLPLLGRVSFSPLPLPVLPLHLDFYLPFYLPYCSPFSYIRYKAFLISPL